MMQAAGDIFTTAQAASTLADVGEAWRLAPDLGAALLAGDCLQLLQGDSPRLSLCNAVMCCTPHIDVTPTCYDEQDAWSAATIGVHRAQSA